GEGKLGEPEQYRRQAGPETGRTKLHRRLGNQIVKRDEGEIIDQKRQDVVIYLTDVGIAQKWLDPNLGRIVSGHGQNRSYYYDGAEYGQTVGIASRLEHLPDRV